MLSGTLATRKVRWNAIIVSGAGAEVPTAHQAVPTAPHGAWHGFRAVETPTPAHSFRASRPNHRRTVPAACCQRAQNVLIKCGVSCARRHVVMETPEAPGGPSRRIRCLMSGPVADLWPRGRPNDATNARLVPGEPRQIENVENSGVSAQRENSPCNDVGMGPPEPGEP